MKKRLFILVLFFMGTIHLWETTKAASDYREIDWTSEKARQAISTLTHLVNDNPDGIGFRNLSCNGFEFNGLMGVDAIAHLLNGAKTLSYEQYEESIKDHSVDGNIFSLLGIALTREFSGWEASPEDAAKYIILGHWWEIQHPLEAIHLSHIFERNSGFEVKPTSPDDPEAIEQVKKKLQELES